MAKEFSYVLGSIRFGDENEAKTEINLWYLSNETDKDFSLPSIANKVPLIVEFDIHVKANESSEDNRTSLHTFSSPFSEEIEKFYRALQNESIADLNASKTKTEYVYNYLGQKQ